MTIPINKQSREVEKGEIKMRGVRFHTIPALLLALLFLALPPSAFAADGIITGEVTDNKTGNPLPGANVIIEGTSIGAATDMDGKYVILQAPEGTFDLRVTFIGYHPMTTSVIVVANETVVVNFSLNPTVIAGMDIVVTANRARERETPVAFTNVTTERIQEEFHGQDAPLLLKGTPGVYAVANDGVGNGESTLRVRGFDQNRVSVMINGIPTNDPESKAVYWSNWGAVSSGASNVQVQRGAGSALYGAGTFGGSMNIVTLNPAPKRSIGALFNWGDPELVMFGLNYNSGLIKDKFAMALKVERKMGQGARLGSYYQALNYYLSLAYYMSDRQSLKMVLHGAPQEHGYTYSGPIEFFEKYGYDASPSYFIREDYANTLPDGLNNEPHLGLTDGVREAVGGGWVALAHNFYHKPQLEFHHSYEFSQKSALNTTLFGSIGRGGGSSLNFAGFVPGPFGGGPYNQFNHDRDDEGVLENLDFVLQNDPYQRTSYSIHNQFGILSTYETTVDNVVKVNFGGEARYWFADHPGYVSNTYGIEGRANRSYGLIDLNGDVQRFRRTIYQNDMENDADFVLFNFTQPDDPTFKSQYRNYSSKKPQFTVFASQNTRLLEGRMNIMMAVQFRSITYRLEEKMPSDNAVGVQIGIDADDDGVVDAGTGELEGQAVPNEGPVNDNEFIMVGQNGEVVRFELVDKSRTTSFAQPKFGINYNVNENLNIFGNVSYVQNEPDLGVFYNYGRPHPNPQDEKLTDIELGFGWKSEGLNAKVNLYEMTWNNKSTEIEDPSKAGQPGYSRTGGRTELIGSSRHWGLEVEMAADLGKTFKDSGIPQGLGVRGSLTYMNNVWSEILDEAMYDVDGNPRVFGENGETGEDFYFKDLKGTHVASGPQTMISFGLTYENRHYFGGVDVNWYGRYYALDGDLPIKLESAEYGDEDRWSNTFDTFALLNLRAGIKLPLDQVNATLSVQVYNLLDKEHLVDADSYGVIPGGLRTIRVSLAASI
ncbi:MAG: hypothetical protein AMJ92_12130 [candidate division Zixibacteria bacterium SM23_81]|nr:MAG: hypothetical protein AMJ92_12130 [candidate division Zixibacteria bacterium SM23_81]